LQDTRIIALLLLIFLPVFGLYVYVEFISSPGGFALISGLAGTLTTQEAGHYGWGKTEGRTYAVSVATSITQLLLVLGPTFYLLFRSTRRSAWRTFYLLLALLTMVHGLLKLSKADVIIPLFGIVLTEYYYRRLTRPARPPKPPTLLSWSKRLLAAVGTVSLAMLLFALTAVYRVGDYGEASAGAFFIRLTGFKFAEPTMLHTIGSLAYGYTASNFENINRFVNSYQGGMNIGISALRPFLSVFGQGHLAQAMLDGIDFNYVTPPTIAMTFINPIYAEFGWVGLILVPIAYSGLVNTLYWRFRSKPSYTNVFLYFNFAFCWVFLFFANAFGTLTYYLNALFIMALGILLFRGTRTLTSSPDP
jgi:hypothetical protein